MTSMSRIIIVMILKAKVKGVVSYAYHAPEYISTIGN